MTLASPPAFWGLSVLPDGVTVGCVIGFLDSAGIYWPAPGEFVDVLRVAYQVAPFILLAGEEPSTTIEFTDTLGVPPLSNVVVVAGESIPPETFDHGEIVVHRYPEFRRGDCNDDGEHDIGDGITILDFLFASGATPGCLGACDINGDALHDIADAIYLFNYLLSGGPAPPPPFVSCGDDRSECLEHASCL